MVAVLFFSYSASSVLLFVACAYDLFSFGLKVLDISTCIVLPFNVVSCFFNSSSLVSVVTSMKHIPLECKTVLIISLLLYIGEDCQIV